MLRNFTLKITTTCGQSLYFLKINSNYIMKLNGKVRLMKNNGVKYNLHYIQIMMGVRNSIIN